MDVRMEFYRADSSEFRSGRVLAGPPGGALVRPHVPARVRFVLVARHAAHQGGARSRHARAARRPPVRRHHRRDPRRAPRLRAVLQARLLLLPPARDLRHLAGRHVVPRRLSRRARRNGVRRLAPARQLVGPDGLRRAAPAAPPPPPAPRGIYLRRGLVWVLFFIGYGTARFLGEFTREPDAFLGLLALGLSMGQWLSLPMVAAGVALLIWARFYGPTNSR